MPAPLPESLRETVKLLVFQGIKNNIICQQTGINAVTLKTWICRHGWSKLVAKTKAHVQKQAESLIASDLASRSQALRNELSGELHDQLASIRSKPVPANIKQIGTRASVVETVTRSASKVYGWGDENREVLVNVTMMSQPIPCGVLEQGVNDKVIDVDTTSDNHQ